MPFDWHQVVSDHVHVCEMCACMRLCKIQDVFPKTTSPIHSRIIYLGRTVCISTKHACTQTCLMYLCIFVFTYVCNLRTGDKELFPTFFFSTASMYLSTTTPLYHSERIMRVLQISLYTHDAIAACCIIKSIFKCACMNACIYHSTCVYIYTHTRTYEAVKF
jgi:hypothetical protein